MSISEPGLQIGLQIEENVELAALTTLGVGGPASFFVRYTQNQQLHRALVWARDEGLASFVLGGGSNLLVADGGFRGLVLQPAAGRLETHVRGEEVLLAADAGVPWDQVVEAAIAAGGAGLEALSGIPGLSGAAPIQNIGAYGQEVAEHLERVDVFDRESLAEVTFAAAECGFAYRQSHFKTKWQGRYVITRLHFRLPRLTEARPAYAELERHLGTPAGEGVPLEVLRRAVLELRRNKSMLVDQEDQKDQKGENGRSAGSFFLNPIVAPKLAEEALARYRERGGERELPSWPVAGGVKLSAAWLIEEAGFPRGYGQGRVGLSTRHSLAIVNRGGADAAEIVALAREIQAGVAASFGVTLKPEPIQLGFAPNETL